MTIEIGSICELKSGGPPMTLCAIVDNDFAKVTWFKDDDTMMSSMLPLCCLDFDDCNCDSCKDPLGFAG